MTHTSLLVLSLPPKLENDIRLNTEDDTVHESAQDAFLQKRHLPILDEMHYASFIDEVEQAVQLI